MESNRKMGARSVERQINAQVIRAGSVKLFIFLAQRQRPANRYRGATSDSALGFSLLSGFDCVAVAGWSAPSCLLLLFWKASRAFTHLSQTNSKAVSRVSGAQLTFNVGYETHP